jgi:hypothetical protein
MRKILLMVWLLDSAALVWLFGYILLHGSAPDRTALAGDLGTIWGGVGAICGWMFWKAKKKNEQNLG